MQRTPTEAPGVLRDAAPPRTAVPASTRAERTSPPPEAAAPPVLVCTLLLAFCSIVYELLLGQTLSAFLGNTVLRYSVTIGLYLLAMGMGALVAGRRLLAAPLDALQRVELALTALGGSSVVLLFAADAMGLPAMPLSLLAHALVLVIGVLTGLEIPLLIEIRRRAGRARDGEDDDTAAHGEVLGVDYAGAFAGTVAFALFFYPRAGLLRTAFAVAAMNAVVGLVLGLHAARGGSRPAARRLLLAQAALLAALGAAWCFADEITEYGLARYLGN